MVDFAQHIAAFEDYPVLYKRILHVLHALPDEVRDDLFHDPRFSMAPEIFVKGQGVTVFMAGLDTSGAPSRSVILRLRLGKSSERFAHYIIAHELAHAFLRNGGWDEITDPEDAADAMAATWGFDRPPRWSWFLA